MPESQPDFGLLVQHVRGRLGATLAEVVRQVEQLLIVSHTVEPAAAAIDDPLARADIGSQLSLLMPAGFIGDCGLGRLPDLLRYLRAVESRLDKRGLDPGRDAQLTLELAELEAAFQQARAQLPPVTANDQAVTDIRWMLEELRVSFFAQGLRTKYPVSPQRVYRAIDALVR